MQLGQYGIVLQDSDEHVFTQPAPVPDLEDIGGTSNKGGNKVAVSNKRKRVSGEMSQSQDDSQTDGSQSWRDVLGPPPPMGNSRVSY